MCFQLSVFYPHLVSPASGAVIGSWFCLQRSSHSLKQCILANHGTGGGLAGKRVGKTLVTVFYVDKYKQFWTFIEIQK